MRFFVLALTAALLYAAPSGAASPVVLFDQGHGQRFVVDRKGELDLSSLADVFREAGFEVRVETGEITAEKLAGVTALVTSGLLVPFNATEALTILGFVERGGALSVMLHVAPLYEDLLEPLGVDWSSNAIHEERNGIEGNPANFRVKSFRPHPLTDGLTQISLYGAWGVMADGSGSGPVAFTSPQSWVDEDRDGMRAPGEILRPYAVIVAGERGRGRFAVFGDDAVFQNRFLDADNRKLAVNLARWLKGGQKI